MTCPFLLPSTEPDLIYISNASNSTIEGSLQDKDHSKPGNTVITVEATLLRLRVDRKLLGSPASHLRSAYRFVHPQL
jgi:hypothetical protein